MSNTKANDLQYGGRHYKQFQFETWDVIQDWGLGYFDGNAVKYLSRWKHKNGIEDLKKAGHYIAKLIEILESSEEPKVIKDWIEFSGYSCPTKLENLVDVKLVNGDTISDASADNIHWSYPEDDPLRVKYWRIST